MRKMKDSGIEWIGDIPKEWTITTIGRLFTAKAGGDAKPFYSDKRDEKHPYPVYTNTLEKNQVYAYTSTPEFPANTITVTGRGDIGHAIYRNVPYDAIIRLNVLLPKFSLDQRYYAYFIDTVVPFFTNSAAIGQLSANQIISYQVCFLPIEEQQQIADYLDKKCGHIDNIMSGLKKQIELLEDYKKSLITETVTKGLNKNVKMKGSGIEWIGDIPEHWQVKKIKYIGGSVRNGLTYTPQNLCDDGILVLRSSNIQNGKIYLLDNVYVSCKIKPELMVKKGDILICSRNGSKELIGKNAIITDNIKATFGAFMMIFRCNCAKYMYYILNSDIFSYYLGTFSTSTINQLTGANFNNMKIIYCPDIQEQNEIVSYLDEKCTKIDKIISGKKQQLKTIENYKKSLIYECVTGKKEI